MPSFCSALGCGLCHSFVVGDGLRVTAPVGTHPAGQVWGLGGQILAKSSKQVQPEAETCSAASRDSQKWAKAEHPAPTWSWSTSSSPVMMMRFSIRVSENPPFTVCEERTALTPAPAASSRQGRELCHRSRNSTSIPSALPCNPAELPLPLAQGEGRHTAAPGEGEGLGQVPSTLLLLSSLTELLLLSLENH